MQPGPDLLENMMVKLSVCAVIGGFRSSAFVKKKILFNNNSKDSSEIWIFFFPCHPKG